MQESTGLDCCQFINELLIVLVLGLPILSESSLGQHVSSLGSHVPLCLSANYIFPNGSWIRQLRHAGSKGEPVERSSDDVEVSMHVKDGGMKLIRILTPDFRWQSGNADVELKLHGRTGNLALNGGLHASKGTISSPFLKYPMTNAAASIHLTDNIVNVSAS